MHLMVLTVILSSSQIFAFEVDYQLRDQILILSQSLGTELSNSIKQADNLLLDVESYLIDSNVSKPKWVSPSLKGIWMSSLAESEVIDSVVLTDGSIEDQKLKEQAINSNSDWEYHSGLGLLIAMPWKDRKVVLALDIEQLAHQISFAKNNFSSLWLLNHKDQIVVSAKSQDWGKQLAAESYTEYFEQNPQEDLWIGQIKGSVWSAYRFKVPGSPLYLLGLSKVPTIMGLPYQQAAKMFLLILSMIFLLVVGVYTYRHFRAKKEQTGFLQWKEPLINESQSMSQADRTQDQLKISSSLILENKNSDIEYEHDIIKEPPIRQRIKASLPLPPNHLFSDQAIEQAIQSLESLPEVDEEIKPIGSKKKIIDNPALGYNLDFEDEPKIDFQRPKKEIDQISTAIRKPGESYEHN